MSDAEVTEAAENGVAESAYGCPVTTGSDQLVVHPARDGWVALAASLLDDDFTMCIDLTAVDYLTFAGRRQVPATVSPERFEVVASFLSHERQERIRARVQVPADDPVVDSLQQYFPGTDHLEREVFDLFGIRFAGHPDLSRILMPETWDGHPLRKDYDIGPIPVQFKGAPGSR